MLSHLLSEHYVDCVSVQAAQTPREPTSAKELAEAVRELVPTARVQVDNTSVRHFEYASEDVFLLVELGEARFEFNGSAFPEAWAAFLANVEQLRGGATVRVGT